MFRVFNLLIALLVLSGCATELALEHGSAVAVIPHRVSDTGNIFVGATINGRGPFMFAIDTGASISVVYDDARAKTGIEPTRGIQVQVLGMTGSGLFPVGDVGEIGVGSESWTNARVALLPGTTPAATEIDGILGIDFLSRYAVLYSHKERVLRLYPKEAVAQRDYRGWSTITLHDLRIGDEGAAVYAFYMRIQAESIPTLFDLGASVNLMNRRAARVLDVAVRRPRDRSEIYGVTGGTDVLTRLRVWKLRIGDNVWHNRIFLVGEFPVFEALGIHRQPAAIAGTDFFGQRDFIIDFSRKRLLVRYR
jgi:predicted aspartyl protease